MDLKDCVLDGHGGIFGKVKYIGVQRLHDYQNAQEESYSSSIGTGVQDPYQ
jgi:hypothetical protein